MSTYNISSALFSAGVANIQQLITSLQSDLPSPIAMNGHSSLYSYAPAGSTSYDPIHSVSGVSCSADEILLAFSQIAWSVNSTSQEWYVRHNISGETLSVQNRAEVVPGSSNTGGKQRTLTLVTPFENLSGSKTIVTECGNSDTGPTSTFYSHVGRTIIFRAKKR